MHIDQLFQSISEQISTDTPFATLSVPNSWLQGRTLFGGLTASLAFHGMCCVVPQDKLIRSLSTNFVGPIQSDKDFDLHVRILRQGKNVIQLMAEIKQDGACMLLAQASFGLERESKITHNFLPSHTMEVPKKPNFIPAIPKITPKYFSHYDLAKTSGGWPFTGSKDTHIDGWMRFAKAPKHFTTSHLVSLIDVWPPTVLQNFKLPKMASSMNWSLEFIHPQKIESTNDWFAYQAKTQFVQNGYLHSQANVWDINKNLIALSRQVVTVFG